MHTVIEQEINSNINEFIKDFFENNSIPIEVVGQLKIMTNGEVLLKNIRYCSNGEPLKLNDKIIENIFVTKSRVPEVLNYYKTLSDNKTIIRGFLIRNNFKSKNIVDLLKFEPLSKENLKTISEKDLIRDPGDPEKIFLTESAYLYITNKIKKDYNIPQSIEFLYELIEEENFKRKQLKELEEIILLEKSNKENLVSENIKLEKSLTDKIKELRESEDLFENLKKRQGNELKIHKKNTEIFKKYRLIKDDLSNNTANHIGQGSLLAFNDFDSYSKLIDYIHGYILARGIYYERNTILDFFALVRTHDFIILAGQSGVGKTKIVKEFARAVNAQAYIIPVKPNWMSKEDLLGYYNPIQKQYISTEFLDALFEAEDNPDKSYFICLDEMNLARIEYYFADFLSKLEDRDHLIEIQLYSESLHPDLGKLGDILNGISPQSITPKNITEYKNLVAYIDNEYGYKSSSSEDYYKLYQQLVPSIRPNITIGNNVHFFGTANIDETTYNFSSKVLDRVQVMKFDNPLYMDIESLKLQIENYRTEFPFLEGLNKVVNISFDRLGNRLNYPDMDLDDDFCIEITELAKFCNSEFDIAIGMRAIRQALNYLNQIKVLEGNDSQAKIIATNGFILHKILPRMTVTRDQLDKLVDLLMLLSDLGLEHYNSYSEIENLQSNLNGALNHSISYWG